MVSKQTEKIDNVYVQRDRVRARLLLIVSSIILLSVFYGFLQLYGLSRGIADYATYIPLSDTEVTGGYGEERSVVEDRLSIEVQELTRMDLQHIGRDQIDDAGWILLAVAYRYGCQLLPTVGIALLIGGCIVCLCYIIGAVLFFFELSGLSWLARGIEELLDSLPYILWLFPFLPIVLWIAEQGLSYWWYMAALYLSFGMFLLSFYIRDFYREFKSDYRSGIFDGERVTGTSEWMIYWRLLRFKHIPDVARKIIYTIVFVMLMEYSMFTLLNYSTMNDQYTVFNQGNLYYEQAKKILDSQVTAELKKDCLSEVSHCRDTWLPSLVTGLALSPSLRIQSNPLSVKTQRYIYFSVSSRVYLVWNLSLIVGLFSTLLILLEIPAIKRKRL